MRLLANLLSFSRIVAAPALLFFSTSSWEFITIYIYCGISDFLDGWCARRGRVADEAGFHADLLGDAALIFIAALIFVPNMTLFPWELAWVLGILFFKLVGVIVAFDKFAKLIIMIPTFLNRCGAFCLFLLPTFSYFNFSFHINIFLIAYLIIASLAVIEELSIILLCKSYDFSVKSIFMIDKV